MLTISQHFLFVRYMRITIDVLNFFKKSYFYILWCTIYWVIFAILVNNCWPNVDLRCSKCWLKVCNPPNSLDYFIKTIKEWHEFVTFLSKKMSSQVDIRQETFELLHVFWGWEKSYPYFWAFLSMEKKSCFFELFSN